MLRDWPLSSRAASLLVAVICAATTALATASPVAAYYQAYNCQSFVGQSTCHLTAGGWATIRNVGATNYSASGDICAGYGTNGGSYQCTSGFTILLCSYPSGVYQYGVSKTYYGDNDNISGHEDDYSNCG